MARVPNTCDILNLDDDLFQLILGKLFLQEIMQLRCVCKTWKAILENGQFLTHLFRLLSRTPLFTVSLDNGFAAYSVEIKGWHKWTTAFHSTYLSRYNVYGQVGDLLLLEHESVKEDDRFRSLCLANPSKGCQRKLPSLPEVCKWDPYFGGGPTVFVPGESSTSCKVFIVNIENLEDSCEDDEDLDVLYKVYLYDSELDSWKSICPWQPEEGEIKSCTFYEGALHCIISKRDQEFRFVVTKKVHRYDERSSCWRKLLAQIPDLKRLRFCHLFEWNRHLMLIGGRQEGRKMERHLVSVHIWQLDKDKQVWVESTRMPDHLLRHFFVLDSYSGFNVKICGHYVYLTNFLFAPKNQDREGQITEDEGPATGFQDTIRKYKYRHVICDLSNMLWWEVSELPFRCEFLGFSHITSKFEI